MLYIIEFFAHVRGGWLYYSVVMKQFTPAALRLHTEGIELALDMCAPLPSCNSFRGRWNGLTSASGPDPHIYKSLMIFLLLLTLRRCGRPLDADPALRRGRGRSGRRGGGAWRFGIVIHLNVVAGLHLAQAEGEGYRLRLATCTQTQISVSVWQAKEMPKPAGKKDNGCCVRFVYQNMKIYIGFIYMVFGLYIIYMDII